MMQNKKLNKTSSNAKLVKTPEVKAEVKEAVQDVANKASNFTKATRVSITVQIPPELEPGTYTVKIRTQSESAFSQQIITVL